MGLIDDAFDLLLAGDCPGCARPGRQLCPSCQAAIAAGRIQSVERAGLALPIVAAGVYVDPLARVISQAKDHHRWDVLTVLGGRLALAVAGLVEAEGWGGVGQLVPLPSTGRAVRVRGLDVVATVAGRAQRWLNRAGLAVSLRRVLRLRPVRDQGGLSYDQRLANLTGAMWVTAPPPATDGWVVLVDDVVTSGASLQEARRTLVAAGGRVDGAATIAATVLQIDGWSGLGKLT